MRLTFGNIPSLETRTSMKQMGFRYKPRGKAWSAKWTVEREKFAKGLAGGIGIVDIKPNWMQKATYAGQMAQKHEQESKERHEQFRKELESIPFGQPILVGHYSEKSHRAHLKRLDKQMEMSMREHNIAKSFAERQNRMMFKAKGESAGLIYRRIEKLEAEKRKWLREIKLLEFAEKYPEKAQKLGIRPGYPSETARKWLTHTQERLAIEREAYKQTGGIPMETMNVKSSDVVATSFGMAKVLRVNPKTVTVEFLNRQPRWVLKLDKSQIKRG